MAPGVSSWALQLRQEPIDRGECGCAFDLWQHDSVEAWASDRNEVAVAELGIGRVDPNIEERLAWPRQCGRYDTACGRLLGGRDRVLEVENDSVGIERQCIGEASRMIARGKHKAA